MVAQGVALGVFRGRLLMRSRAGLGDCPWEVARGLPGAALGGVLGVGPVKSIGGMARESVFEGLFKALVSIAGHCCT